MKLINLESNFRCSESAVLTCILNQTLSKYQETYISHDMALKSLNLNL